jgi:hypothetical protein
MLSAAIVMPEWAMGTPKGALTVVGADKLSFVEPRIAPQLEFNLSAWASAPSASTMAKQRAEMNAALQAWPDAVVASFANAFISSVKERGIIVERQSQSEFAATPPDSIFVRSFLSAGFVYKTYTSSNFAPFVQVVLELVGQGGRVGYHQLYVATDRPFNLFIKSLPPATTYLLASLDSLATDPLPAIEALSSLATQLGKQFASELPA